MQELINIKNLNMHYPVEKGFMGKSKDFIYALNDIDLKVYENEILGLVGESGCGKSTLGKCVLKLLDVTSGEIIFKGDNLLNKKKKELKKFRENAQLIFQNPYASLDPKMTIYETLKEPLIIHGYNDKKLIDEKINNIADMVGIDKSALNNYPHEFSGGQRQRIAIARAIILHPKFIVADEPVSALDVSIQAQIINLLLELKEKLNLTFLFISHDLSIIKYVSDRVAVMYLGEVVELGTKSEIFDDPKHPYTTALLSAIPTINRSPNEKKIILQGDLPSPQNPPKGCKFHTRCPYVMDMCYYGEVKKTYFSEEHFVRCHLFD